MKTKIIGALVALAIALACILPGMAADNGPAVVIKGDECELMGIPMDSLHQVISNDANDNVKLTCKGMIDDPPEKVIKYSGPDDGVCGTSLGNTTDWHMVVTPSGQVTLSCFIHRNSELPP